MSGPERFAVQTGPRDFARWARERFAELVAVLTALGIPWDRALWVARAVLAQWVRENGFRGWEFGFNPGNVTGSTSWGWHRIGSNPLHFRQHPSLRAGVLDTVKLLSTGRYRAAWDALVRGGDPVEWYAAVTAAGYSSDDPHAAHEYASILRALPARVRVG